MEKFFKSLEDELNYSITENGAKGFATTKNKLLDINFIVPSLRGMDEDEIFSRFMEAFNQYPNLAFKWLFYLRDVRGGLGERRSFRAIIRKLAKTYPNIMSRPSVIKLIPKYGRWDDVLVLIEKDIPKNVKDAAFDEIVLQLREDISNYKMNKPYSLLAKWLPSINGKDKELAVYLAYRFGLNYKRYRKLISNLRKRLNVVEVKMSANEWSEIEYENVPSRANLFYSNAFKKHDFDRRNAYLNSVNKGEAKINAGILYPHDIIHRYPSNRSWNNSPIGELDETVEALWKNLPNYVNEDNSTMVVCDGSGSMTDRVPNSNVQAIEVSRALAIYFSERMKAPFKDKFITFSKRPQFVDLSNAKTLFDKYNIAKLFDDCSNTDLEKVFNLILDVAVKNNLKQDELPKNILIISDMEFDISLEGIYYPNERKRLFEVIENNFAKAGYKLPRLIFWNVNSRTNTIPVKENENGVALVGGYSPSIAKMVLSQKLDPWECLKEVLLGNRYSSVIL